MAVFTKSANEIFAPTTAGGASREIDPGDTQTWGGEVETGLSNVETSVAQAESDIATLQTTVSNLAGSLTITSVDEIATTSGTAIEATGLSADVKRIVLHLRGVSTNEATPIIIQLGTSGGYVTSGYVARSTLLRNTPQIGIASHTSAFDISNAVNSDRIGIAVFERSATDTHIWTLSGYITEATSPQAFILSGYISLGAALDRIRLTSGSGTATFDGGALGISYWS